MEKSGEPRKKTLKSYASRVFQESSVGVVSSLANTASKRRQVYKVIAFIFCLIGFLYQSITFLAAVFEYPTTVGIDITRPSLQIVPAFTFCDNNGINRKLYCKKYPDRCEIPSEEFCQKYTEYCGENVTLVPKREYYFNDSVNSFEDLIEVNNKQSDFVTGRFKEDVTGPYIRPRDLSIEDDVLLCYSLHERINSSLPSLQSEQNLLRRLPIVEFEFKVSDDEVYLPGNRPGVLFSVHNPFQAVNPFETGAFMKPGRGYKVFVSVDEEVLLPRPYGTDCENYTELWIKNGFKGPRMQETCKQNCMAEISLMCYGCIMPQVLVGDKGKYCTAEDMADKGYSCRNAYQKLEQCFSNCKDDCRQTRFSYTVQERFSPHFSRSGEEIKDLDNKIKVEVFLEGEEIVVLKYTPKYMFVEVFSNIGGFIGCWLGINLLDITDIMDGFFRIFRYSLKRR